MIFSSSATASSPRFRVTRFQLCHQDWWAAHELGHLIVSAKRDIGKPMFGIDDDSRYSEHYRRCMEIAAMCVSRKLLTAAGRADLADQEAEDTDTDTMYYDDRGGARAILRRRQALRIPRTREGLVAMLASRNIVMSKPLEHAIQEARRIRRRLVRWRRSPDLGGDCAIASLLMAAAIGDVSSLRHHDVSFKSWSPHVWNVVEGVIIDVTATQFNDLDEWQPYVRGVLVTREPRIYHGPVSGEGTATLAYLAKTGGGWYDEEDEVRRFRHALAEVCGLVISSKSHAEEEQRTA